MGNRIDQHIIVYKSNSNTTPKVKFEPFYNKEVVLSLSSRILNYITVRGKRTDYN